MPRLVNVTAGTLPLHLRGFKAAIETWPKDMPDHASRLVNPMTTDQLGETLLWVSGLPRALRIREGQGVPFAQLSVPKYKAFYTAIYAIAVELTDKWMETNQSDRMKNVGAMMGRSQYYARQRTIFGILDNITSSSFNGIDGVPLGSASHPTKTGTFSNISTPETLSPGALKQMTVDAALHKTWQDEPWEQTFGWTLFTHTNLRPDAWEILESTLTAQEMSNTKNYLASAAGITGLVTTQYLSDTNAFTLVPNGSDNPLFELKRGGIKVAHIPGTIDFTEQWASKADYTVGWRGAWGVQTNAGA